MTKGSFIAGTSTQKDFWRWIMERHKIWIKRQAGDDWPWTDDEFLRKYKFTNVFREADRGTLALRRMLDVPNPRPTELIFNVAWYRVFNRAEHAEAIGFVGYGKLCDRLRVRRDAGHKIFTGAHMTWAPFGVCKTEAYLETLRRIWDDRGLIFNTCRRTKSLESVFDWMLARRYPGVARFLCYEIVTDLRWIAGVLDDATDKTTWANIGPGCKRGLQRLGMPSTRHSLLELYEEAMNRLPSWVLQSKYPFELREIEHSLCEFDKYQRVSRGEGKMRGRYHWKSS